MNNGTCADLVNDFRCTCNTGYTGKRCEVNIGNFIMCKLYVKDGIFCLLVPFLRSYEKVPVA